MWRMKCFYNLLNIFIVMNKSSVSHLVLPAMCWCRHGLTLCCLSLALNALAATPPLITTQPASQTVLMGSNATFTVVASTGTTLSYAWFFNGLAIPGATNSAFTVAKVQFTNAGPYYVNVINAGGTVKSAIAALNVNPPSGSSLAAPWVSADIGTVGLVGSAYNVSNNYTINGSGASLVGSVADQFHFIYQTMPGNGSIAARVTSQSGTNVNGYAGVMIRETTATGSRFVFAARQGNGTTVVRSRPSTGGATTSTNGPVRALTNCWLELVRTGTNIAALTSTNGSAWVPVQTNGITMATNVIFGLFVTSGNTNVLDSDGFTNITVVP